MAKKIRKLKVSDRELKCLEVLVEYASSDYNCVFFNTIAKQTGLDKGQVRRSVRSLTRKGLAAYITGLVDDDGMLAGSGYYATRKGVKFIEDKKNKLI